MPFQSEKQRRYLHANHPEIAKRWERDYANGGILDINESEEIISDDGNDIELDSRLLIEDSEQKLFQATESIAKQLSEQKDYKAIVRSLLELKEVIDTFFDSVMVNVDDIELKQARLKLINRVRSLFLSVADISYLSS